MGVLGGGGVKGRSGRKLYLTLHCHLHQNGVVSEDGGTGGDRDPRMWG